MGKILVLTPTNDSTICDRIKKIFEQSGVDDVIVIDMDSADLSGKVDKRIYKRWQAKSATSRLGEQWKPNRSPIMFDEMDKWHNVPSCTDPIDESVCGECDE